VRARKGRVVLVRNLFRGSRLPNEVKPDASGPVTPAYHAVPGAPNLTPEEAAPNVNFERYNYDRMALIIRNIDFRKKRVMDFGCNSGWFSREVAICGAESVIGLDFNAHPEMGGGLGKAAARALHEKLPIKFVDIKIDGRKIQPVNKLVEEFVPDFALVLSVAHHIPKPEAFFEVLAKGVQSGVVYEHHEFWNDIHDDEGNQISVQGEGHRFGWNEDLTWLDGMGSLESHKTKVESYFLESKWFDTLKLDGYSGIKFLGFSEKRRPLILMFK